MRDGIYMYKVLENSIVLVIVYILIMIFSILKYIHIIQLNNYNLDQQIIWYKKNKKAYLMNIVLLLLVIIDFFILDPGTNFNLNFKYGPPTTNWNVFCNIAHLVTCFILIPISLIIVFFNNFPKKQKKKLVLTNRIKRLVVICVVIFALWLMLSLKPSNDIMANYFFIIAGIALSPLFVFIAFLISLPIENKIRRNFMNEAHEIIKANDDLYVIGITGSFGKTSVKHYLHAILREKYAVCMTPESFNTPMGATLTIKNDLKNIDDIFICEMGARRVGDIKEICDIVNPIGGIITDVGEMHLDTFKNIENVAKTKFELFDSAISNENKNRKFGVGTILLNGDNKLIGEKVKEYKCDNGIHGKNIYFYGINENNDFYASDIKYNDKGTSFVFKSNVAEYPTFEVNTKLLGYYNVMNLVAAIAYALVLKIDKDEICSAVNKIGAVAHRLEILNYDKDTILIDDAYNANLNGAKNASDVLSKFDGYTKVIITPGMVELGDKQDEINESFAEYAGKMADYAIVVGSTNKSALNKGFEKNLREDKLINVDKVEVAIGYALQNISGKKVILLENDLSDNY